MKRSLVPGPLRQAQGAAWSIVQFLAWRFLFSTRSSFIPLLAATTLTGIALSVFFLMVVLGVMRGFQKELNERWIGLNAHLTITKLTKEKKALQNFLDEIKNWPEIEEINQFVTGEVIVQATQGKETVSVAAQLKGVDKISKAFLGHVKIYPPFQPPWPKVEKEGLPPLLGGSDLFSTLGIYPDYPEVLKVIYPFGEIGPAGDFVPKTKSFRPTHVFRSGLYAWDANTVLVPFQEGLDLLREPSEKGLQIRLRSLDNLEKVEKKLRSILPGEAHLETFANQNARLFAALKLERFAMTLLLILFLTIASFSMTGLLFMFLYGKQRDLAILRAIGLSPGTAQKIYLRIGCLLGGTGSLLGVFLGLLACYFLKAHPILLPSTYYLDYLPVKLEASMVVGVLIGGIFLSLISSWYPARRASRMMILPLLREE